MPASLVVFEGLLMGFEKKLRKLRIKSLFYLIFCYSVVQLNSSSSFWLLFTKQAFVAHTTSLFSDWPRSKNKFRNVENVRQLKTFVYFSLSTSARVTIKNCEKTKIKLLNKIRNAMHRKICYAKNVFYKIAYMAVMTAKSI